MNRRSGVGGLLTRETEQVDLGEHAGLRLEGRIERRTLQIGLGGRRGVRLELSRARPTSVQVSGASGVEVVRMAANPDPWLEAAQRILALTIASMLVPWLLRRRLHTSRGAAG